MRIPRPCLHATMACCIALSLALPSRAQMQTQTQSQAQTPEEDLVRYSEEYVRAAGYNAALFNGKIQERIVGNIESLYLRDRGYVERNTLGEEISPLAVPPLESYSVGDVLYDGVLYVGVRMRLDLWRDELVAAPPGDSFYGAILDPTRLEYADLRGYRIVYLPASTQDSAPREGYYQQLHKGRLEVLRKEGFEFDFASHEFTNHTIRYYIAKDGVYHRVPRRKGPVLRLFRDRRSELDRFIRSAGIDFRRNPERALIEVVKEYERLTDR